MTKIFLSPSSQERNLGAINGYIEEIVCNMIADVVQRELIRQKSYEIMRNLPSENYLQHTNRSNAWGAQLHIAIHTNANNGMARGLNAGCLNPADTTLASTKLTKAIFDRISPLTPAADKMVKYTFNEVTQTHCPCAYIEISFHDNVEDCKWILSHIEDIGIAFAKGIVSYENKIWISVPAPVVIPPVVAPVGSIVVGGKYSLAIIGNSASDLTGTPVILATVPATCIKIALGTKNPYGMDYKGDGYVGAWFPANAIKI